MVHIHPFPLEKFEELLPLLLRCFPEFWEERLGRDLYSFPYDVELFTLEEDGKIIGNIGIHPYHFYWNGRSVETAGISDVCIDPDFRGRGYSKMLLAFAEKMAEERYPAAPFLSLYTDKPKVYYSSSFREYFSNRSTEIQKEDFPKKDAVTLSHTLFDLSLLNGERNGKNEEERMVSKIISLYDKGKTFPGKCLRTPKFWQELFAEPSFFWQIEEESYFLYKGEELYEGYSSCPEHKVNSFTPANGGHNGNFLMVKKREKIHSCLGEELAEKKFIFPIADTF